MIDGMPDAVPWHGPPCVVARSIADVRLAATAGVGFTLLSARAAASFAGCLAWQALARLAREAFADLVRADILDCADAPGRALEALRLGQKVVVLDGDSVGFADVAERAAVLGASVLPVRPPAFDPGIAHGRATPRLRQALAAHLAEVPPPAGRLP